MLNNSLISFVTETAGTQDVDGNILPATKTNSAAIPCNCNVVTREYRTMVGGEYKFAQYKILVDLCEFEKLNLSNFKEINLTDSNGAVLGLFQLQNIEILVFSKKMLVIV